MSITVKVMERNVGDSTPCRCLIAPLAFILFLFLQATEKLYTGLYARDLIKKHFSGAKKLDDDKWKVFVFCKFKPSLQLTSTTQVLCQVKLK